jgi:exopolysaccharide biosynthesis polyprenyl glycosylphosphotransferase
MAGLHLSLVPHAKISPMKSQTLAPLSLAEPLRDTRSSRRGFREHLTLLAFVVDAVVICAMLLLAYGLRFETPMRLIGPFPERITLHSYLGHIALGAASMLVLLVNYRVYHINCLLSFAEAAAGIAKAAVAWLLGFMALSLIMKFQPGISRLFCFVAFTQILTGLLTWRLLFRKLLLRDALARRVRERVVFVGWTEECGKMLKLLGRGAAHPYEIAGVIEPAQGFGKDRPTMGIRTLGAHATLRELLRNEEIDVVIVPDMSLGQAELSELAMICEKEMVDFKVLPSCFQILLSGLHLESINGVPVLGISKLPLHSALNQGVKRAVDILGALVGLILSAPLIALFGLLVRLENRGPIFYRQQRSGRNGRPFTIYKIRSMRVDSEADGKGARWAQKDDPRCLRVGAFIRKWNIDEIPQFWNVLKGDMSLVGPRPERPELIQDFREAIPHYNARHDIKPGITGWAQVNGLRGNTDLEERIKFDLYYIENWNVMLDFQIMAMTFFKRDNAY